MDLPATPRASPDGKAAVPAGPTARQPWARQSEFMRTRFTPGEYMGLELTLGIGAILLAAWAFGAIAGAMAEERGLSQMDLQMSQWLRSHASDGLTRFLFVLTSLHGTVGLCSLALALGAVLWFQRHRHWALSLLLSVPGVLLLNVLVKQAYHRARPTVSDPMLILNGYSFPSGHTAGATALYGFMAIYLIWRSRSWPIGIAVTAGAIAMVALVALSRIYLGVHYFSDTAAAVAEGVAWVSLCVTAVHTLAQRRQLKRREEDRKRGAEVDR